MSISENENAIMDAYKRNGSRTGLNNVTIIIRNETDLFESFENVQVVFCPSPPKYSAIEINVQDNDKKKYTALKLKRKYFSKDKVVMKYQDTNDFQYKIGYFEIDPENNEIKLSFDVKTVY